MIGLIDCNNFYVSCERAFQPRLEGVPVGVLSNNDGCVIARSNELKALARMLHRVSQKSSDARLGGDKRDLGWSLAVFLIKFLCSGRTSPHPHVFSVPGTARRDAIPAPACWPTSGRGPAPDTGCSTSAEWSVCCE